MEKQDWIPRVHPVFLLYLKIMRYFYQEVEHYLLTLVYHAYFVPGGILFHLCFSLIASVHVQLLKTVTA